MRENAAELHLDHVIAGDEVVDVAIDEPVFPDRLEHEVEKEPAVLGVGKARFRRGKRRLDLAPELGKEIRDDRFLRMIVVVEIAGADAHFEGD